MASVSYPLFPVYSPFGGPSGAALLEKRGYVVWRFGSCGGAIIVLLLLAIGGFVSASH